MGKRTMDFKVSYLDAGLTNSYFSDSEQLPGSTTGTSAAGSTGLHSQPPSQPRRRYKTHLRDFLSTCRTKRKLSASAAGSAAAATAVTVEYPAAAVQASSLLVAPPPPPPPPTEPLYTNLNTAAMYSAGPYNGAAVATDNGGYHQTNYHQTLYDTRIPYLTAADNLFQYR